MNLIFSKNIALWTLILFLGLGHVYSQMGCTDPFANNFNSTAITNDGSCTYNFQTVSSTNSYLLDDVISETSGLIYWNDTLWTHNDSEDPILYKLNPANGAIAGNVSLYPQVNRDWEEISQDEDFIYIGDFGNNTKGNRTDLQIIRVSKASILAGTPEMDNIYFTYEDQVDFTPQRPNNTDYDCESFIVTEDAIFLFTKEWVSNGTRVYKLPKIPGTFQARLQDSYDIRGMVTGVVYVKEKGLIVLSGYSKLLQPYIFLLYDFMGDDFFGGNKRKLIVNLPFHQVEGITTQDGLNYFITNERFDTTGTLQHLFTLDLTPYLGESLGIIPIDDADEFEIFLNPSTLVIEIKNKDLFPVKYSIFDSLAKQVWKGNLSDQNPYIDVSGLSVGTYILKFDQKISKAIRFIKK